MIDDSSRRSWDTRNAVMAIGVGGLIAGTLEIAQALTLFGKNVPLAIAAGLLGPQAFRGDIATFIFGVLLHFFIALSVATIYFAASRKLSQSGEVFLSIMDRFIWPYRDSKKRAKWGVSENNRKARFYSLTPKGREQLVEKTS
jgi:hypothetical protein